MLPNLDMQVLFDIMQLKTFILADEKHKQHMQNMPCLSSMFRNSWDSVLLFYAFMAKTISYNAV